MAHQWPQAANSTRRHATGVAAALLMMVVCASSLASAGKLQGVHFSILTPDEQDGTPTCLSLDRVRSNLDVLVRLANRILLPSIGTCLEQTRLVLSTAEAHGLRVYLGMDARGSSSAYHAALMTLSKVAQSHHSTIGAVLVGNGAISDHGVSPADLLEHVHEAKRVASPFYIPVSTSEPWSLWANGPHMAVPGGLIHELDFVGVSIQPWLEGVPVSCGVGGGRGCLDAVSFTATTAARLTSLGKAVVVTETGWPSNGNRCCATGNAGTGSEFLEASVANANKYLNDLVAFAPKASHDKINYFYSEVFDSPSGLRGLCPDVEGCEGAPRTYQQHWGIFDPSNDFSAKSGFDLSSIMDAVKPALVVATSHAQALSSGRPARSGRGSSDVILPTKIVELMSAGSRVDHVLGYTPAMDGSAADAMPQGHAAAAKATAARRSRRLREVELIHPPPPPPAPPRTFRLDTLAYQPADPTQGWCVDAEHLQRDMAILASVADGVRLFSFSVCNSQNLQILNLASQQNMKVMVGITVRDPDYAEIEFANLAANVDQWHHVISTILVDCEAIQARVMTVPQMAEWMKRVKALVGKYGIPVTTADGWGIWANATNAAILGPVADLIGVQNHPYWGGTDIQHAARQTLHNIRKLYNFTADYGTKKVLLTETGWPTGGENCCPWSNPPMRAVPGEDGLQMFMNDFASLARAPDIAEWLHGYIFFEAFDADAKRLLNDGEGVKCNIPCTVEYHWGLFRNDYNLDAGTYTRIQKEAVTPLLFAVNDWKPSPPPKPPKPSPPPSPGPSTPRPFDAPNMPTSPPAPQASACNGNVSWYCGQCHSTSTKAGLPQLTESCHLCVLNRNKYGGDYQCTDCFQPGFTAQQVVDCMACVMRGNAGWKCINFCSTNDTSINRDCQKCVLTYNSWYTKKPGYEWECAQLQWYCENTASVTSVGGQKQCRSCISQGWGNSYNCQECAGRPTAELRQGCVECLRDGGQFWDGCNNAEPKPVHQAGSPK